MIPENSFPKKYFYCPAEDCELRSIHRLKRDLGVNQAAVETILRLCQQVFELQSRLRQMEIALTTQLGSQQIRLASYREVCDEAIWIELEILE
jgi:DNA-binding transcriptional MerR regulator